MPNLIEVIGVALVGYLIGSVSFAVIIARRCGVDILREGSCNPGATNVKRVLGKRAGNLCFGLDFLKGLVAAGWPLLPFIGVEPTAQLHLAIIGLIAAILGHSFSIFLGFRGGKGVATTMGGLVALAPLVLLLGLATWVVVFYTTRYVSLASILFGVSLPIAGMFFVSDTWLMVFLVALALLIVIRHRSNIQRLLKGTENRFSKK